MIEINELKSKPDFNPQSTDYIDLLIRLAEANIRSDTNALILKDAYNLSIKTEYYIGECNSLTVNACYFSQRNQIDKSIEYFEKALEVANNYNLDNEKIKVLNNWGQIYWRQGDDANALTKYLEAVTVAEKLKDHYKFAILNVNIANLYDNNTDYETALSFYEISKQISIEINNQFLLAHNLLFTARIYSEQEKFADAEITINQSIEILEKQMKTPERKMSERRILQLMIDAYEVKGAILLKRNDYENALIWLNKSEKLCDELDFGVGYTKVYSGLANCYFKLDKLKDSEEYALKALQISKEINVLKTTKESNLILSKIYHKKGLLNKAYEYQSEYIALYTKGSVDKFKKGLGVLRSKMEYESQKKLLVEENENALAQQKRYLYIILFALLILIIVLGLIYRTNTIQKRFTSALQNKQNALLKREAELRDSNHTKDKLFSVIAHDLKGPINSFYNLMKLYLDQGFTKEEYDTLFPKALNDIHSISDMLNNLLQWAKTQMQGVVVQKQHLDMNSIVSANIQILNPLAEKKTITITNHIARGTFSYIDKDNMDIVIRNLISNAIKFTNRNGEIHVNAIEIDNNLQIEVKDNGVGMSLEAQSNLFENNRNKSTYGTNNEKGTGLGLSLCKEMVESNGGKIWVSSVEKKGAAIYFTVPLKAVLREVV